MGKLDYRHLNVVPLAWEVHQLIRDYVVRLCSPSRDRTAWAVQWKRLVAVAATVTALICQIVILYYAAQLVDLCVSLMEVWVELAHKHLEIVNSR